MKDPEYQWVVQALSCRLREQKDQFGGHMDETSEAEGDGLTHYCNHLLIQLFHLGSNYQSMGSSSEVVERVSTQLLCKVLVPYHKKSMLKMRLLKV